jgi:hypothetical protein
MSMQMLEPDYWKGRGRYSKQACRKSETDARPLPVNESDPAANDTSNEA